MTASTTVPTAPAASTANHLRGILLMLGVGLSFTVLDATAKHLTQTLPVLEIAWGRYLFHLAVLPLFLGGQTLRSSFRSVRPGLQILRSSFLLGSTVFFFLAVKYIPLADATAIGFVSPLLVTGLSVPILGEHGDTWWNSWTRWIQARGGEQVKAPAELGSEEFPPLADAPGLYVTER